MLATSCQLVSLQCGFILDSGARPLRYSCSGSNTTGCVAERLGRKWLSIELDREYAVLSALRFMETCAESDIVEAIRVLERGQCLRINSLGLSATEDHPGDAQMMEESQASLFKHSRTGTRYGS